MSDTAVGGLMRETRPGTTFTHWFADLRVRSKVLLTIALMALVTTGVGVLGLTSLAQSSETARRLYEVNVREVQTANDIRDNLLDVEILVRDAAISDDPDAVTGEVADVQRQLHANIATFAKVSSNDAAAGELRRIGDDFDSALTTYKSRTEPFARSGNLPAWRSSIGANPYFEKVDQRVDRLIDSITTDAREASAQAQQDHARTRTLLLLVMALGIALGLGFGLLIATKITQRLALLKRVVDAFGQGDLTASSGLVNQDEIGLMGASMDAAVGNLRGLLHTISESSVAVAASSEELSAGTTQIAATAEETSAQATVVAGAADEVSRNVSTSTLR